MANNKFTAIILVLTVIASVTVCAMASEEVQVKSSSMSSEKKENIQSASAESLKSPSLEPENPKSPSLSEKENQKSPSTDTKSSSKQKSKSSTIMYDDETLRNMNDKEKKEWAMRVMEEHKDDVLTEKQKATLEKLNKMNDEQMKEWVESVLKSEKPKHEVHNSIRGNLVQSGGSIESEFCIAGCMNKLGSIGCTTAWNCAGISKKACAAICPS